MLVTVVRGFLDPVLAGDGGTWNPKSWMATPANASEANGGPLDTTADERAERRDDRIAMGRLARVQVPIHQIGQIAFA